MKSNLLIAAILLTPAICCSQQAEDIIGKVKKAQESISTLSYQLNRTDTLGNYVRNMHGTAILKKAVKDTVFGFWFWAKKDGDPIEKMYDGHVGYDLNTDSATYEITTSVTGFYNLLNGGGGHLILPDLIKLDLKDVLSSSVSQDDEAWYLMLKYPDIEQYGIINKFKALKISKRTMLPVSVRIHQESLGRRQDLYYEVENLRINDIGSDYDFADPKFLKTYQHIFKVRKISEVASLKDKEMPFFKINSFTGGELTTADFKGKAVLLDFWEVWCGPCLESMPKVEALYEKYKSKGLLVYGITNDLENLDASRQLVKARKIVLPMLSGSSDLRKMFKITGVPTYLLINKEGKVSFISEGYSELIEEAIQQALL